MLPALLLQLAIASLEVSGSSTCPRPAQVAERVHQLAPGLATARGTLRATVSHEGDGVRVELKGADDQPLAERLISGSRDCEALASATSVVLVSWAREFEASGTSGAPPSPQMPESDLAGTPTAEKLPLPEDRELWTVDVDVSAGLSASIGSGGVAMGGLLTGGLTSRQSHFGGQLSLAALGARSEGALLTWERFALLGGPHYRFAFTSVDLDVEAGVVAALLSIIPQEGGATTAFDPGATVGLRLLSHGGLWAGAQGIGWFAQRRLPTGAPLPRFELLITGGLAWSHP